MKKAGFLAGARLDGHGDDRLGVIPGSGGIDFDYRFSQFATHYIMGCLVATGSSATDGVVVRDGSAVTVGGGCMCEGEPVPPAVGGLPAELWMSFDYFGINEAGQFLVTGDTGAATDVDEFVFLDDRIVLREGDLLSTPQGEFTVSGAIESAYMNEDTDWVVTWDVDDALAVNREALILNGELLLLEGNAVDLDGNGTVEPNSILVDFTCIASLVVSDRDVDGFVSVYFTADVDTLGTPTTSDDTEALFRITWNPSNQLPVAHCRDVTVEAGPSCEAQADIDDGSYDPDGQPITLGQSPPGPYGLGTTGVTLTVTDSLNASAICSATVTVVPQPLELTVTRSDLNWGPAVCDLGYDLVRGDLATLLQSGGNYSSATVACLANDIEEMTVPYDGEPAGGGDDEWYLARRIGSAGNGSYDSGGESQQGLRDSEIAFSGADCP